MRRSCLALFLVLSAAALAAQQAPAPEPPPLLYVHEEIAKPSMIADYERISKELGAAMRGANIPFHYDAVSTDDFHYYFVLPMKSFGDVDKIMQTFMVDLPQKVGKEKVSDLMRRGGATMEMTREWILVRRDDISYSPAKPRLNVEEATHFQYDFYYLKPGMEDMVDQISNEWKAALQAANINDGFTVYQAAVGGDLPLVVVVNRGRSAADLATQTARNMETLGEKGRTLLGKTFSTVRKFETKIGRLRPDLSNPAPRPQAAAK
jgi:hypothetical protein